MNEKTIGIVGGMGPEATLDCYGKIIQNTPAHKDQDHLRVLMDSNPKAPDRTAAILGDGESPVSVIVNGCQALARAGADFIIIPCVSAHFFLKEIADRSALPILSIFDAVTEAIERDHPDLKTVGLVATAGTVGGGLFQKRLARNGIQTVVPTAPVQATIMDAIYDIKNVAPARSRAAITADLVAASETLITGQSPNAQAIVAGCTEIPLALKAEDLSVPYFDALTILARAAIRYAGLSPIS
jgi:aspartate racemase